MTTRRFEAGPDSTVTSTGSPTSATSCPRSEEHTSELQSRLHLVCRLLLEKNITNTLVLNSTWLTPARIAGLAFCCFLTSGFGLLPPSLLLERPPPPTRFMRLVERHLLTLV